jgi:hypothetical protein
MKPIFPHYMSGGEVQVGDRIRYKGVAGNVVFVSDGENGEFATGYEDYFGHQAGIMVCDDDGVLNFIVEPDESLEFVRRKNT